MVLAVVPANQLNCNLDMKLLSLMALSKSKRFYSLLNIIITLLAWATKSAGQSPIATDDTCLREQAIPDNLSCPRVDGQLQCFSRNELCNQEPFCDSGVDEGTAALLSALNCELLLKTFIMIALSE